MHTSNKKGIFKSLTAVLIVVLALCLMLAGCTDKTARKGVDEAKKNASDVQKLVDDAKKAAADAQATADEAKKKAEQNAENLTTEAAVSQLIIDAFKNFAVGDGDVTEGSVVTIAELEKFVKISDFNTYLTECAKAEDLNKAIEDTNALKEQVTKLNEAFKGLETLLGKDDQGKYALVESLIAKMGDFQTAIEGLTTKSTELKTELNRAIEIAKEELVIADRLETTDRVKADEKIVAALNEAKSALEAADTTISGDIDALRTLINENKTAIANIKTDLISQIQDAIIKNNNTFDEATEAIIVAFDTYNAKYDEFVANKLLYTEEDYKAIEKIFTEQKIRLIRAQSTEAVAAVLEAINAETGKVQTIADRVYEAYKAVSFPLVIVTASSEDDSLESINAAKTILELAGTQLTTEQYNAMIRSYVVEEKTINLDTKINEFLTMYAHLEAAKADAAAVIAEIEAIPAYADLKADQITEREALRNALETVNTDYENWKNQYFGDETLAYSVWRIENGILTAETLSNDVNIDRIIDLTRYNEAKAKLDEIEGTQGLATEAANLDKEIVDLLTANGYLPTKFQVLYSEKAAIDALSEKVEAWCTENGITSKTTVIPNYDNLNNAKAYAADMTKKYDEANVADTGVIALIDAANAKDLVLASESAIAAARDAITAWTPITGGAIATVVDADNFKAIIGEDRYNELVAAEARMVELNNALAAVVAINDAIDNFGVTTINSMDDIRAIRNNIVTWLNTYNIVPAAAEDDNDKIEAWIASSKQVGAPALNVTGDFYQVNYDMLHHDALETIIEACEAKISEAVAEAKANVIPLINAINAEDAYMLYQNDAINAARDAYREWLIDNEITIVNLEDMDFGDGVVGDEAEGILVPSFIKLINSEEARNKARDNAQNQYLADKAAYYDALTAISDENGIIINVNNGAVIKAAYDAVEAWKNAYIDEERGFNEVIKKIANLLGEDDANKIEKAYADYEALVAKALEDGKAIEEFINKYISNDTDKWYYGVSVYYKDQYVKAYADYFNAENGWAAVYGVTDESYTNATLDARLMFMATVRDTVDNALNVKYTAMIAKLKDIMETTDLLKSKIMAIDNANLSIYDRDVIDPLTAAYAEFIVYAGLDSVKAEAYDDDAEAGKKVDSEIKVYKEVAAALAASEIAIKEVEDAKNAETKAVIDEINAIVFADITTATRKQITDARASYNAWLLGTKFAPKDAKYAIDTTDAVHKTIYAIDAEIVKKLTDAEDKLDEIDVKLNAAKDAIAALAAMKYTDDKDAYVAAIALANEKKADFYAINGNANNDGLTLAELAEVAKARMSVTYYDYIDLDSVKTNANYETIIKGKLETVYTQAVADAFKVTAENYASKGDGAFETLVNGIASQLETSFNENKA